MTRNAPKTIRERRLPHAARVVEMLRLLGHLKADGKPTWPDDFAQRCGYTDRRALRPYPEVYDAVRAYARNVAPDKMGTGSSAALRAVLKRAETAVDASALAALREEVRQLSERAEHAVRELDAERRTHAETRASLSRARAMVDALGAYLAQRDVVVGRAIEEQLHALASEVTGLPKRAVQKAPIPGAAPALVAEDGGAPPRPRGARRGAAPLRRGGTR